MLEEIWGGRRGSRGRWGRREEEGGSNAAEIMGMGLIPHYTTGPVLSGATARAPAGM